MEEQTDMSHRERLLKIASHLRASAVEPAAQPEPIGEVVGEHRVGFSSVPTIYWNGDFQPVVGTKLYAHPPAAGTREVRDAHRGGNSYEASMLRDLLARIHGDDDGGHYVEEHGLEKAMEDAHQMISGWRAGASDERDELLLIAIGALADIAMSDDMTLEVAKRKASRIHAEITAGCLADASEARNALTELVALQDLKDHLASIDPDADGGHDAVWMDYYRRQPIAWANARRVLGETK